MRRAAVVPLLFLVLAVKPQGPSISWNPQTPHSGETVTFTASAPGATDVAWDFDGNGTFDAHGATASTRWTSPGVRAVTARTSDARGRPTFTRADVKVLDAPPVAAFGWAPAAPAPDQQVAFASQSTDPDGGTLELQQAWDLDGDGTFGDATGATASAAFAPGDHVVRLRVVDGHGAAAVAEQVVHVATPAPASADSALRPALLSPFPVVRLRGRITASGLRVLLLIVSGPRGARVGVACHGRGCPSGRVARAVPSRGPRLVALRHLRRVLRPGARLEIFVTQPGRIGKYTKFVIRSHGDPLRSDRCLDPGATRPARC
jgi:hypothetical protein